MKPVIRHSKFFNPEDFEAYVAPVAGEAKIRPHGRSKLHGRLRIGRLARIGFLAIDSSPMGACIQPAHGFYGLTLTLNRSFDIKEGRHTRTFDRGSGHVLHPEMGFDFRAPCRTSVLGTNFFVRDLRDHARLLGGEADSFRAATDSRLSLTTPTGSSLLRYLLFVWEELNRGGGILNSALVAKEIEDGLIAALVWALEEDQTRGEQDTSGCADVAMVRAEEYLSAHLCDPVERAALAEVAGVSIRTLSRGFLKRHGVGPMTFLRQRRLEAVRAELLLAEPGSTTVSKTALRYGFSQLGKFSAAYKAVFHEFPSKTLQR